MVADAQPRGACAATSGRVPRSAASVVRPAHPVVPAARPMHDLAQSVADLAGKPGASRELHLHLPVPEGFELEMVTVGEPVLLDGVLESVVDGMLVRGDVAGQADMACSRCLETVVARVTTAVTELYQERARLHLGDEVEEGYEIVDETIDLSALVRDALSEAVPANPLCRPDCAGLCPHCGINLNEATCDYVEERTDPRWDVLRGLSLGN